MRVCGVIFLVGIALAAAAERLSVLIIGRLLQVHPISFIESADLPAHAIMLTLLQK